MNLPSPSTLAAPLLGAFLLATGCQSENPPSGSSASGPPANPTVDERGRVLPIEPRRPTGRLISQKTLTNPLDADRAMGYLTHVANIGPRPSGSRGMLEQRKYIVEHFQKLGASVSEQTFDIPNPLQRGRVPCANLIVQWHPDRTDRVLVCAHYDTRPLPEEDPNPQRRRNGVFLGANDGASGVAVLMELAHHMADFDPAVGVDFILFDAEELVYGENVVGRNQQLGDFFYGSTYFARQYRNDSKRQHKYHWGVLLDMVGDADLEIRQELQTVRWRDTRPLLQEIWTIAARLEVKEFVSRTTDQVIRDDHLPLRNIGKIPTVNLIDAQYPDVPFGHPNSYWHTEQDIPRHCSGESLAKVGWVVLEWLKTAEVPQAPAAGRSGR